MATLIIIIMTKGEVSNYLRIDRAV